MISRAWPTRILGTGRGLIRQLAGPALTFCALSEAPAAGQIGPPASFDTLPPCCTTPSIIRGLSSRPANESRDELFAWIDQRSKMRSDAEIDLDIAALEGACETRCAPPYQLALDRLRLRRSREIIPQPPCCEDEEAQPIPAARAASRNEQPNKTMVTGGPKFRSSILSDLLLWRREFDEVPEWLGSRLERLNDRELRTLNETVAGWCTPERRCPPAIVIGRQTIERHLADRQFKQARTRAEREQAQEVELRWWEWATTLLVGLLGALIAILSTFLTLSWGQRHTRRHALALEGTLDQMTKTLRILERRERSPRRVARVTSGRKII